MVHVTKPAIVAALVIAPALAAPIAQAAEEEYTRGFNDEEAFASRDFEDDSDLVERTPGPALWATGAAAFAAAIAARPLGESLATIFRRPKNPTFKRSLEDDEDVFERGLDFDDDELLERELEEYLEARTPVQAQTLIKIGTALGKHAKWLIPAGGLAGMGIGLAGKLRSRELDGDFGIYEREIERSLDELD